jgi:hypothetical protein
MKNGVLQYVIAYYFHCSKSKSLITQDFQLNSENILFIVQTLSHLCIIELAYAI